MRVFVSAGEISGDRLAARVMNAWKALRSDLEFAGCAGVAMRSNGCTALAHSETFSHVGWSSVLSKLPVLVWHHWRLQRRLSQWQPDCLIFVDSPGLHLPILKKWKKRGIPCLWIAPPQLWAWKERRIPALQDLPVVPLHQFEVPALQAQGARAHWFGYLGEVPTQTDHPHPDLLALLPGSRPAWRDRHLNLFADAGIIAGQKLGYEPVFVHPQPGMDRLRGLRVLAPPEAFAKARLCLGLPGTGLLEASLNGVPSVAAAQPSALDRWMAQKYVAPGTLVLTNRLLQQNIVPELYQPNLTPEVLAQTLVDVAVRETLLREELTKLPSVMRADGALKALARALNEGALLPV